ncbi:Endoglucanase C precursor [Luteitalea pratensis]|uniref:Endoglucanase C n=1 Tax=Luteitalea pratensis TaxID=1855912 RepID=A0A143PYW0_LUTPR|nr:immunoglobulin domain-containing protein [Luteitalea pratensis]AMY12969.1 Endoglucanase C precursor [Luteitalea pratensis]
MLQLKFENENTVERPIISVAGFPNLRRQFVRIVGKTATTLSFYPPLYNTYPNGATIAMAQQQVEFAGVEDLKIEAGGSTAPVGVQFDQTFGSWVKNVRVRQSTNYNVSFSNSLQCELRGSYLDELNHGGSNGAGLLMNTVTGCLVEDNIIRDSFPGIEINAGSSGNVVAYNFINNSNGLIGIDTNHAPHNDFNLYEGNIAHNLMSDGYFGSNSDDTLYRNWLTGLAIIANPAPSDPIKNSPTWCLSLKRFTRNYSIVGNILGSGAPHVAQWECDGYGQPNIGNGASSGEVQPSAGRYWADWNPVTGTNIVGTIVGRHNVLDYKNDTCVNCGGTLSLTSGKLAVGQTPLLRFGSGASVWTTVKAVSGDTIVIDSSPWSAAIPAVGTGAEVWPGAVGYQELDLDVRATTIKKGNYSHFSRSIPPAESLSGVSFPPSLFRRVKPPYFGDRPWPAIDPLSPGQAYDASNPYRNYEAVPAAYRYFKGSPPLGVNAPTAPIVSQEPRDLSVQVGQSATFTVLASGVPNPTYQWKKNGVPVAGATLPSYSTPATTGADSGSRFSCVVTNASGSLTTREASLAVGNVVPPTAPQNLRVRE